MKITKLISICLIIACVLLFASGCILSISAEESHLQGEYAIESTVSKLDLNQWFGDTEITYGDEAKIIWDYTLFGVKQDMHIAHEDGLLSIVTPTGIANIAGMKGSLSICLPTGSLDKIELSNASGRITMNGNYTCDIANISAASGKISIDSIKADEFKLNIASGSFNAEKLTCTNARFSLISGAVNVTDGELDTFSVNNVSGNIQLDLNESNIVSNATIELTSGSCSVTGAIEGLTCNVVSGECTINTSIMPHTLDCDVTSGLMTLNTADDEAGFEINYKRTTGNIRCNASITGSLNARDGIATYKNGTYPYTLETTSGTIRITIK